MVSSSGQHGCPIAQASRARAAAKMRVRHASQEKPRVALKCDTPAAPNRTPPTRSAWVSKSATSESDRRAGYRARWISNRLCRRTGCRRAIAFGFQQSTMSPALPAAFTSRGDRWQARASCLTFPHAAGAMDKIQASTDRSVGRRHELVNRTNENILYKRPMSRAFSPATILMGSNRAFTSLPAQTNRRRQPSRP